MPLPPTQSSIGSKKFTESYVLAEIAKHSLETVGFSAEHRQGMGGTIILWEALRTGQIALYPEYTGTIAEEILKTPGVVSLEALRTELARFGVGITDELGFNNTYALVMRRDTAAAAPHSNDQRSAHASRIEVSV